MAKKNLANILPTSRYWTRTVTKIAKRQMELNPKHPFLSNEEKTRLFLDWKHNKNIESRDKLMDSMYVLALQLVHQLINVYGNNNVPVEDLEQEANHALLDMLCNSDYDPEMGTLPTYFRTRLKMFFHPALKSGNHITLPDNTWKQFSIENKAFNAFVKKNHRYPAHGETYTYNGREYLFGDVSAKMPSVLEGNKTIGDEEDSFELFDLIGEADPYYNLSEEEQKRATVREIIHKLSKREQEILHYAFFTEMETQDIVYNLKPCSPTERKKLYTKSKNTLEIKTSDGKQDYTFFVYRSAKIRRFDSISSSAIEPLSHPYKTNFQYSDSLKMTFKSTDVLSVSLNGQDITNQVAKLADNTFQLNCKLKVGCVFSQANYNHKLSKIKEKIRTKIVEYEIFRPS